MTVGSLGNSLHRRDPLHLSLEDPSLIAMLLVLVIVKTTKMFVRKREKCAKRTMTDAAGKQIGTIVLSMVPVLSALLASCWDFCLI